MYTHKNRYLRAISAYHHGLERIPFPPLTPPVGTTCHGQTPMRGRDYPDASLERVRIALNLFTIRTSCAKGMCWRVLTHLGAVWTQVYWGVISLLDRSIWGYGSEVWLLSCSSSTPIEKICTAGVLYIFFLCYLAPSGSVSVLLEICMCVLSSIVGGERCWCCGCGHVKTNIVNTNT